MFPLVVIALVFVAIGIWLFQSSPGLAVIDILFFGVCGVVILLNMLPNGSYLQLTEKGFTVRKAFRLRSYAWDEVGEFGVSQIGLRKMVGWNPPQQSTLGGAAKAISGLTFTLPETYGYSAEELAELLNGLRDQHAH